MTTGFRRLYTSEANGRCDVEERARKRILLPVLAGILTLLVGWHFLCHLALEDVLSETTGDFVREHLEGATAHVQIGPITNVIDIRVERTEEPNPLAEFLAAAAIELIRKELEPEMERAVRMRTRRSMDVYAMILPYTVSITVDDSGPSPASGKDDSLRGNTAVIRAAQQALADCGYDVGHPDGILGPRTEQAVGHFRLHYKLNREIALSELPALVRERCPRAIAPDETKRLITQLEALDDRCRGGSGDDLGTMAACDQRQVIVDALMARGWCYGHEPQPMAERHWEPCHEGEH